MADSDGATVLDKHVHNIYYINPYEISSKNSQDYFSRKFFVEKRHVCFGEINLVLTWKGQV